MSIKRSTALGSINITDVAVANLAGSAVIECYGVVAMTSRKYFKDGFLEFLKKDNFAKGVIVRNLTDGIEIDLYVVISYGIKVTEVVSEIQKRVKYSLEKVLNIDVKAVNVYVQGIQVVK